MNPANATARTTPSYYTFLLYIIFIISTTAIHTVTAYKALGKDALGRMANLSSISTFNIDGERLKPLLVPRVAGTPENARVRQFIVDHFQTLGWHVQLDTFQDDTPFGKKTFTNVIATHNPDAQRRLILSAHFDSKYYEEFEFIGATDSAVPCAIMMDIAETLNPSLNRDDDSLSLQMVFFDGEEAFVSWTDKDSIYGARHLAERWETSYIDPPMRTIKSQNELSRVDVLVLLDLLGTPNPTIPNYYRETSSMYYHLVDLETRLGKEGLLETHSSKDGQELRSIFNPQSVMTFQGRRMGDDHVPFLHRGVNILHIIPQPFPSVWHNEGDNASCIDPSVVHNLATLFRGFVLEYLELSL